MNIFDDTKKQSSYITIRVWADEKELISSYAVEHGYKNTTDFIKYLIRQDMINSKKRP